MDTPFLMFGFETGSAGSRQCRAVSQSLIASSVAGSWLVAERRGRCADGGSEREGERESESA